MNNLLDSPAVSESFRGTGLWEDERMEDFLDHLCAPLVGVIPYRERQSLRCEVRLHLEGLLEEYGEKTDSPDAAIEAALHEFGEPWQAGEAFLKQWNPEVRSKNARPQNAITFFQTFAWFSPPTALCLLLLEQDAFVSGEEGNRAVLLVVALVAPLLCGFLTGYHSRGKTGTGILSVVGLLALFSLLTGMLLLPNTEGIYFGLFQLFFWLPVSWLTATTTVALLRMYRRLRFLRPTQK